MPDTPEVPELPEPRWSMDDWREAIDHNFSDF